MKPTASPPSKLNARFANLNCAHLSTPTLDRPQPVNDVNGRSRHQSDLLDIFVPNAAPDRHHPIPPPPSTATSPPTPTVNTGRTPESPLLSFVASTSVVTPPVLIATALHPNTPTNINLTNTNTSDVYPVYTCPHCDRTFTSHIGLDGHLRTHRTEIGKLVTGAPTYT
ncbi:hypothetical protein SprV_0100408200 [Sparganum proliferum]